MQTTNILNNYPQFINSEFTGRFIKHTQVTECLSQLPDCFEQSCAGTSFQGRSINLVKWGNGPVKVFLWSQMHGDEATGTIALFDLFNYLSGTHDLEFVESLRQQCTLYILPMVNPDGAAQFTRRNAQHIDINRDFIKQVSPEARLLRGLQQQIQPHFGFNLHDQSTLWSVKGTAKPATLSFLAPAYDENLSINSVRENAMLVIADIFNAVSPLLPQQIGLFDDEYEGRAFGDNFQAAGTSVILIEAGGYQQDTEKQQIRRYYFLAVLAGLHSISTKAYQKQQISNYFSIPKNNKEIFHILITDIIHQQTVLSIGLCYEEEPVDNGQATLQTYIIQDIGDLNHLGAYTVIDGQSLLLEGDLAIYKPANFRITAQDEIIFDFKNGILQSKL